MAKPGKIVQTYIDSDGLIKRRYVSADEAKKPPGPSSAGGGKGGGSQLGGKSNSVAKGNDKIGGTTSVPQVKDTSFSEPILLTQRKVGGRETRKSAPSVAELLNGLQENIDAIQNEMAQEEWNKEQWLQSQLDKLTK